MADVETAQQKLEAAQAALDQAKADADTEAEAAKRPRPVSDVMADILRYLCSRAGNHPVLEKLVKEWVASSGKPVVNAPLVPDSAPRTEAPQPAETKE